MELSSSFEDGEEGRFSETCGSLLHRNRAFPFGSIVGRRSQVVPRGIQTPIGSAAGHEQWLEDEVENF